MKKNRLAALFVLAPVLLFGGCGGGTPALSLESNWYALTSIKESVGGTHERLVYTVVYQQPESPVGTVRIDYDEGSYTTELVNAIIELPNGKSTMGYRYTTVLSMRGRYFIGDKKGEDFEDSVHSEVEFLPVNALLRPVRSTTSVKGAAPLRNDADDFDSAYHRYEFDYNVEYTLDENNALTGAKETMTDLLSENGPVVREYGINSGEGTFLDNAEIIFGLRGLGMSASVTFQSINPSRHAVQQLGFTGTPVLSKEKFDFKLGGEQLGETEIGCYTVKLSYRSEPSGMTQTYVYAAKTDANSNVYRNVPLRMEVPLYRSFGTFVYSLAEADFADK